LDGFQLQAFFVNGKLIAIPQIKKISRHSPSPACSAIPPKQGLKAFLGRLIGPASTGTTVPSLGQHALIPLIARAVPQPEYGSSSNSWGFFFGD
jgi:hypothetical protein